MVVINDNVYGEVEITDQVLIELMASAPLQRLKKIDQHGAHPFVDPSIKRINRYDHSVGAMILLRLKGATLEEQIAGLLHDVPHTAFSHVIDWVFTTKDNAQDFHEKFFEKIVMNSEIPNILEKHGFDVKRVLNEHLFGLLERNSPDLCADRLDYSFRDFLGIAKDDGRIKQFIEGLVDHKNEFVFNNKEAAFEYAKHYLWMDKNMWACYKTVAAFHFLASAIKEGLDSRVLTFDDLFLTDDVVIEKLRGSSNLKILNYLSHLTPNLEVEVVLKEEADVSSFAKLRYVDPKVSLSDGSLKRVSEIYPDFLDLVEEHRKRIDGGIYLKIASK